MHPRPTPANPVPGGQPKASGPGAVGVTGGAVGVGAAVGVIVMGGWQFPGYPEVGTNELVYMQYVVFAS
jgi:hypothetical protein